MLKYESGHVFAAFSENVIVEFTSKGIIKHSLALRDRYIFTDIIAYRKGWMLSCRAALLQVNDQFRVGQISTNQEHPRLTMPEKLAYDDRRELFGIHYNSFIKISDDQNNMQQTMLEPHTPLRNIFYAGKDTFLVGCADGVYYIPSKAPALNKKIQGIDAFATKIIKTSAGIILAATKDGLFMIKKNKVLRVDGILNIPGNIFFDITEDRYGNIWLASNMGLVKISKEKNRYNTQVYSVLNGLPSDEIYKVAADSGNIYVSSSEGLCSFPLDENLGNTYAPPIYLETLLVNGHRVDYKTSDLAFPYGENTLRLSFDALTFKGFKTELLYRFRGTGNHTLKKNAGNVLVLDNLSPGTYELVVYAVNNDGIRSTKPAVFKFVILKPFWQTVWFIATCLLILFTVIYLIFKASVKRIKGKEAEKTKINKLISESKLGALQAQMNPHFIFNAINSIQNYILKQKEQDAYDYLAKFSKLIRMVLNNSRKGTIQLSEELETIGLYIELEQLRFKDKFDFELQVEAAVDIYATFIPVMIMQPFIENAIWHGLMNVDGHKKGILAIRISMHGDRLKIVIEDNGIGRARSEQNKKAGYHSPIATALTEQRLAIINQLQGYETTHISITDLYNEAGAQGTRIEIWIPIHSF